MNVLCKVSFEESLRIQTLHRRRLRHISTSDAALASLMTLQACNGNYVQFV